MKFTLYYRYAVRSLKRDGSRTALAILCIAIAVMAMVALQLVGQMISSSLLANMRGLNGGDISIMAEAQPFVPQDLTFFEQLRRQGIISSFSPIWAKPLLDKNAKTTNIEVYVVQPNNYPAMGEVQWITPSQGEFSQILQGPQVIVDQKYAQQQKKHIGDEITIKTTAENNVEVTLSVRIAGIIQNKGHFLLSNGIIIISDQSFHIITHQHILSYNALDISTNDNQSQASKANASIEKRFPAVTTHTVSQLQATYQQSITVIQRFLDSVGLLALLIAGVGIMHTIQVFLARRTSEIAILKTSGYRKRDLYALFGLETIILGFIGGTIGACGSIGVSYAFFLLLQQLLSMVVLTFSLNPFIIVGGIGIGVATAVIFGWMPIVQASNARPLLILRSLTQKETRTKSWLLNFLLLFLLSIAFFLMTAFILQQDWKLSFIIVYTTILALLFLRAVFLVIIKVVGHIPIPERGTAQYLTTLIMIGFLTLSAVLFCFTLKAFGIIFLALMMLMVIALFLLPESWRMMLRMALWNFCRQRSRTTTMLMVLFVGVFAVSLILILGVDMRAKVDAIEQTSYNLVLSVPAKDAKNVEIQAHKLNSIDAQTIASHPVLSVHIRPKQASTPQPVATSSGTVSQTKMVVPSIALEGFDLNHQQGPDEQWVDITSGRTLTSKDAQSNNIILNDASIDPTTAPKLLGTTLVLESMNGKIHLTATIVGFFHPQVLYLQSTILASQDVVKQLSTPDMIKQSFYFYVDPANPDEALATLGQNFTPASFLYNSVSIVNIVQRFFNSTVAVLMAMGGFSILAAMAVIANAVSLSLLERQRELGILKAVGYTNRRLLSIILLENAIIAILTVVTAILPIVLLANVVDTYQFHSHFDTPWYIMFGIATVTICLVCLTSFLVALGTIRMQPLEVLRYE